MSMLAAFRPHTIPRGARCGQVNDGDGNVGLCWSQMQIDPKGTVAGWPALLVRRTLRRLRTRLPWGLGELESAAAVEAGETDTAKTPSSFCPKNCSIHDLGRDFFGNAALSYIVQREVC